MTMRPATPTDAILIARGCSDALAERYGLMPAPVAAGR